MNTSSIPYNSDASLYENFENNKIFSQKCKYSKSFGYSVYNRPEDDAKNNGKPE